MLSRRSLLMGAGMGVAGPPFRLTEVAGEKISVLAGAVTLLEYRYSTARPKPYIHPLCLADGRVLTLDGPEDHVHHRGLMVAWSAVNGFDFWGEVNPARHGRIVHQRFVRRRAGVTVEIIAVNHWLAENQRLLVERRTLRVAPPGPEGVWLDWVTQLTAALPVVLAAGEHVYNGLGIRLAPEMNGGSVLNSNGTTEIQKANGEPARWCAYFGAGAGIAFFDHPTNPRHPNAFFVMNRPFGYMSAAPTFRAPFKIAAKGVLGFRWGVLAFGGEPNPEALQRRFEFWTRNSS